MYKDEVKQAIFEAFEYITLKNFVKSELLKAINWNKENFDESKVKRNKGQFASQTILSNEELEQVEADTENFKKQVDLLYSNKLSEKTQPIVLSKITKPWSKFTEIKEGSLIVNVSVLKKIDSLPNKFNKNHNVPQGDIERLPLFLADPLYITQSSNEEHLDRYIAILPLRDKKTKERISVIVQPSEDKRHAIVSAYGEIVDISEERKAKRLKYDKNLELSKTASTSSLK